MKTTNLKYELRNLKWGQMIPVFILVFHISSFVFAGSKTGTTAGQFLDLPVGARAIAMGSAQAAIGRDATALYYNPASLSTLRGGNITMMYADYFQSTAYQQAAVSHRIGSLGTFALGYQGMTYGSFEEVDNTGQVLGTKFKPTDTSLSLGMGKSIGERWDAGAAVKYISSKISDSASTFAIDAGGRMKFKRMALAASVANLGGGLKFQQEEDDLPQTLRFGSAFYGLFAGRWISTADIVVVKGVDPFAAFGGEYAFQLAVSTLAVRGGYNTRYLDSDLNSIAGFSAGLGFAVAGFLIDYAWAPFGDLGDVHRVSLGYEWGQTEPEAEEVTQAETTYESETRTEEETEKKGGIGRFFKRDRSGPK